jgi:hypothetical protein
MKGHQYKRVTIWLTPSQIKTLKKLSKEEGGLKISAIIRNLINEKYV